MLQLCSRGQMRRKKAEEGDPVEMVSTKFTNAAGEEQSVTGMFVRKNIHNHLVHSLKSHEDNLCSTLKAQGVRVVDAQMRAVGAGPSHLAAPQQATAILKGTHRRYCSVSHFFVV